MKRVTRKSLQSLVTRDDEIAMHAVGRACVALFRRQTSLEQKANDTRVHNNRGFTPADARRGSLTAKTYMKNKSLEDWQVKQWTKLNAKGVARIAKYWQQLDEIAQEKVA